MNTPEFSEFSFGHALVDSIMHGGLKVHSTAPIFPNLKAEGSAGGGYDVEIPARPVPLFLQFKIPQIMVNRSELMPVGFWAPYYRMHLRTAPINQHNMLFDLEKNGNWVLYASPMFDKSDDLGRYYSERRVTDETAFFSPCDIGVMDETAHHVAYARGHDCAWARSKPRKLNKSHKAEAVQKELAAACAQATKQDSTSFISSVLDSVVNAINNNGKYEVPLDEGVVDFDNAGTAISHQKTNFGHARSRPIEPAEKTLEQIVHLSRTYLDCEFFMLSSNNRN